MKISLLHVVESRIFIDLFVEEQEVRPKEIVSLGKHRDGIGQCRRLARQTVKFFIFIFGNTKFAIFCPVTIKLVEIILIRLGRGGVNRQREPRRQYEQDQQGKNKRGNSS